jgi:endonuclease/exonuclease/phosphatase family metal-dependent hydrolase
MTGASAGPRRLRVVTWNVRAGIGPGEPFPAAWWRHVRHERLAGIAAFLRGLAPDIVTLQEVAVFAVDGQLFDEAGSFATATGLNARYAAANGYPLIPPDGGPAVGAAIWGNAILTRGPLADVVATGLPRAGDDDLVEPPGDEHPLAGVRYVDTDPGHREGRCVVGGVIVGAGAATTGVAIATTHLTYIGRAQRLRQAAAARQVAESIASERPLILTGDRNAAIDAPELAGGVGGLTDALAAAGVPAGDERRRTCGALAIDHVLVRGLDVVACRVAGEAGELSDHSPVVADLAVS